MADQFASLASSLADSLESDWASTARPNQLAPAGDWRIWMLLAGRGFGKTRSGSEWVRAQVESGTAGRIALVAPTASDCRDVIAEGPSGILAISPKWNRPTYQPSIRRLTWPNGAIATLYSADEPERLRGPQHDAAWCDELASFRYPDAWHNLHFGLRMGRARCIVTATPKPVKLIRDLIAQAAKPGSGVIVTRGSTFENAPNLSPAYIQQITDRYSGTRLGRQELHAEVLEDAEGALWSHEMIEASRVTEVPQMVRVCVAIDPAGSSAEGSDETGIIVAGLGQNGHGYILDDLSGRYAPIEWARRALGAFHTWKADKLVAETNFGAEMVIATLSAVDPTVPVKAITSSRGKVLRAQPIAAYFEQQRAHFVGAHDLLEDQCCNFTPDFNRARDGSPDRVDAAVFALSELLLNQPLGRFFREASFLVNDVPPELPRLIEQTFVFATASETDSIVVVYCGATAHREISFPLSLLDWEIAEAAEALTPEWLARVLERARALAVLCGRQGENRAPLFVEDTPFGRVMREFAEVYRFDVQLLDAKALPPPDLLVRATAARSFVSTGAVKICRPAYEKTANFRGVTKNHLMSQILGFDPEKTAKQDAVEFVAALCAAIVAELPGRKVSALPVIEAAAPAADTEVTEAAAAAATARAEYRAAQLADLVAWEAEAREAIAAIRVKINDPYWQPRSMLALGIRPRPEAPGIEIA
jgi:phage terminase large subunit-like protein